MRKPLRVFLCHSSQDKLAVRKLYKQLTADGVDAWLDEEKLIPGQVWQSEIPRAVRDSDVIIICISKTSISKEGYLQKEIRLALDVAEEKPEGTIFLIPAKLEECEVPDRLKAFQWVNLFEVHGYEKLLGSLSVCSKNIGTKSKTVDRSRKAIDDYTGLTGYLKGLNNKGNVLTKVLGATMVFLGILMLLMFVIRAFASKTVYPNVENPNSEIEIGLLLTEVSGGNLRALQLPTWETAYLSKFNMTAIVVSLDYVYISPTLIDESVRAVCIKNIMISQSISSPYTQDLLNSSQSDICLKAGLNIIVENNPGYAGLIYSFTKYADDYYYPFDKKVINFSADTEIYLKKKDGEQEFLIPARVSLNVSPQNRNQWDWRIQRDSKLNIYTLNLSRSMNNRLLVLSVLFFLITGMVYMFFLPKINEFWFFVVGFVIGLWFLSDILTPAFSNSPNVISNGTIFMYILLAVIVVTKVGILLFRSAK